MPKDLQGEKAAIEAMRRAMEQLKNWAIEYGQILAKISPRNAAKTITKAQSANDLFQNVGTEPHLKRVKNVLDKQLDGIYKGPSHKRTKAASAPEEEIAPKKMKPKPSQPT